MQTDAEAYGASLSSGFCTHLVNLLFDLCRRLTPGEINIDLFGRQLLGGFRRATKPQRGTRLLHRFKHQTRTANLHVLAFIIDGFAFQHPTPDAGKLGGFRATLAAIQKNAPAPPPLPNRRGKTPTPPGRAVARDGFPRQRHRPMRPRLQRIRHLMPGIDHELPGGEERHRHRGGLLMAQG